MAKSPEMTARHAQAETLDAIVAAALAGARAVMAVYRSDFEVRTKQDSTPVSRADEDGEAEITAALAVAFPDIPVVGEEACARGGAPKPDARFFLVDALDGTKEFIRRSDEFTVNIGLVQHGVPSAGVVVAPARDLIFAADDTAAWRGTLSPDLAGVGGRAHLRTRPVPSRPVAVASRSHCTPETERALEDAGCVDRTSIGSSLKFCLLAEGKADFYPRLGPTMEWDTAAGDAVLRAAGGTVLTIHGEPLRYGKAVQPGLRPFENPFFLAAGDPALVARLNLRPAS